MNPNWGSVYNQTRSSSSESSDKDGVMQSSWNVWPLILKLGVVLIDTYLQNITGVLKRNKVIMGNDRVMANYEIVEIIAIMQRLIWQIYI